MRRIRFSMTTKCWWENKCLDRTFDCFPCDDYLRTTSKFKMSWLPEDEWEPDFLNPVFDKEAFTRLREILNDLLNWVSGGGQLYLYSENYGNGKSSSAKKLLKNYIHRTRNSRGVRGIYINVSAFIQRLRNEISHPTEEFHNLLVDLKTADLVVWDDIGAVRVSPFIHENFFPILEQRINTKKANIYTSNLDLYGLEQSLDPRLVSRIWNACEKIEFKGKDWRGVK